MAEIGIQSTCDAEICPFEGRLTKTSWNRDPHMGQEKLLGLMNLNGDTEAFHSGQRQTL
jgi:hypothetical protein